TRITVRGGGQGDNVYVAIDCIGRDSDRERYHHVATGTKGDAILGQRGSPLVAAHQQVEGVSNAAGVGDGHAVSHRRVRLTALANGISHNLYAIGGLKDAGGHIGRITHARIAHRSGGDGGRVRTTGIRIAGNFHGDG